MTGDTKHVAAKLGFVVRCPDESGAHSGFPDPRGEHVHCGFETAAVAGPPDAVASAFEGVFPTEVIPANILGPAIGSLGAGTPEALVASGRVRDLRVSVSAVEVIGGYSQPVQEAIVERRPPQVGHRATSLALAVDLAAHRPGCVRRDHAMRDACCAPVSFAFYTKLLPANDARSLLALVLGPLGVGQVLLANQESELLRQRALSPDPRRPATLIVSYSDLHGLTTRVRALWTG